MRGGQKSLWVGQDSVTIKLMVSFEYQRASDLSESSTYDIADGQLIR